MASIIRTDSITTVAGSGNISLQTGNKIVSPDVGGLVAPGQVIQTKYAKYSSVFTTNSTTFVDIGLSVAITPKYVNSLILVRARVPTFYMNSLDAYWGGGLRLMRDSTIIEDSMGDGAGALDQWMNLPVTAAAYKDFFFQQSKETVDVPSTLSQITYKVQCRVRPSANTTLKVNYDGVNFVPHSVIIVQEIAQ